MSLDPQVKELLDELNAVEGPPPWEQPIAQVRADFATLIATLAAPGAEVGRVENRSIPGPHGPIPVRIYWPQGADAEDGSLPVFVHFHGSGFVVLGLNSHDHVCRTICNGAHCIVVAVDYRKAPENKFPKPTDDAWAATLWAVEHCAELRGDERRVAVGGDSAGGCIAAVVTQRAKAEGGPALVFQLLVYPVTDARPDMRDDTESYGTFADGYLLTADTMRWFIRCYLNNDEEKLSPVAAPLRAADLSGLPSALVITAGYDPLHDEGVAYAKKLRAAGVPTELLDYEDQIHGFWASDGRIDAAKGAHGKACAALRQAFDTA